MSIFNCMSAGDYANKQKSEYFTTKRVSYALVQNNYHHMQSGSVISKGYILVSVCSLLVLQDASLSEVGGSPGQHAGQQALLRSVVVVGEERHHKHHHQQSKAEERAPHRGLALGLLCLVNGNGRGCGLWAWFPLPRLGAVWHWSRVSR